MEREARRRRGGAWGWVLAVSLIAALPACSKPDARSGPGDSTRRGEPRTIEAATVSEQMMERAVPVIGSLAAQDQATLSIKVPGRLKTIAVDLGSVVKQGQLLAQVDPKDYELQLRQAEAFLSQARARLGLPLTGEDDSIDADQASTVREARARVEEARKNRDRIIELNQQGILSDSEKETAIATYEVAENRYRDAMEEVNNRRAQLAQRRAEVDIARKQLEDTSLVAPFDGTIQERRASPGEYLVVGTPVVTIVRTDPLRLRVEVPERESMEVRAGQKVRVRVEGGAPAHLGAISRVSPALRENTRMLVVEADIPNDGSLRPGSFVRADIVTRPDEPSLSVPARSVFAFAGLEKVFVVEENRAVERQVTTGRRGTNWVEVLAGVRIGEQVVLDPGNLQHGDPVRVDRGGPAAGVAGTGS